MERWSGHARTGSARAAPHRAPPSAEAASAVNALAIAGPNSRCKLPGAPRAGFCAGFWHGMLLPVTLLVSVFNAKVEIYETYNRGRLYDFGFVLGAAAALGGGGSQVVPRSGSPPPIPV